MIAQSLRTVPSYHVCCYALSASLEKTHRVQWLSLSLSTRNTTAPPDSHLENAHGHLGAWTLWPVICMPSATALHTSRCRGDTDELISPLKGLLRPTSHIVWWCPLLAASGLPDRPQACMTGLRPQRPAAQCRGKPYTAGVCAQRLLGRWATRALVAAEGPMSFEAGRGAPLFSFGVAADAQYADIPDGRSFHGVPRFYRGAVPALRRAVAAWRQEDVAFSMHLGDILDGFQPKDRSEQALTAVLDELHVLERPVYHMLGNHCLYNLPRAQLNKRLSIPEALGGASYYSFSHCGHRFVVLDSYDVSELGWPEEHPLHQQAHSWLRQNNPNHDNLNSPEGVVGLQRRFVKFGGGVSDAQLAWLSSQLQAAKQAGERVLVFGHLPLCPDTCPPVCLLWNYDAVLELLRQSGVVAATFAGHTHQNGYVLDSHGIHHIVLPGIVETPPGQGRIWCGGCSC